MEKDEITIILILFISTDRCSNWIGDLNFCSLLLRLALSPHNFYPSSSNLNLFEKQWQLPNSVIRIIVSGENTTKSATPALNESIILWVQAWKQYQLQNIQKHEYINHWSFFFAEKGRCFKVFIKVGSAFHLGGFNWVLISSGLYCILFREPSRSPPVFLWDSDLLTTPLMLKLFSLFFNSFHRLAFSSALEVSSEIVGTSVLSPIFSWVIRTLFSSSFFSSGGGRSILIPFCLKILRHSFLRCSILLFFSRISTKFFSISS